MAPRKPELASSDPVADQQARTDAAAEEITQAADAVAAQLTATQEELAEAQNAIETLTKEVEAEKAVGEELAHKLGVANATVADRDASMTILANTNEELKRRVAELEATGRFAMPDEAQLHHLWTAAGGDHGRFETAKRFAGSLG